jgi:hypothetical protein
MDIFLPMNANPELSETYSFAAARDVRAGGKQQYERMVDGNVTPFAGANPGKRWHGQVNGGRR